MRAVLICWAAGIWQPQRKSRPSPEEWQSGWAVLEKLHHSAVCYCSACLFLRCCCLVQCWVSFLGLGRLHLPGPFGSGSLPRSADGECFARKVWIAAAGRRKCKTGGRVMNVSCSDLTGLLQLCQDTRAGVCHLSRPSQQWHGCWNRSGVLCFCAQCPACIQEGCSVNREWDGQDKWDHGVLC